MLKTIKILGFGDVVKYFLNTFQKEFPDVIFEVYCRSLPPQQKTSTNILFYEMNDYHQDDHPTIFCCSTNEANTLQTANNPSSRLTIAIPNLQLIQCFLQQGLFKTGLHFILTNPSELITEYLIRHTRNKHIFALGLSVDLMRYQTLISEFIHIPNHITFNLVGNHWDFPIINFAEHFPDNSSALLEKLRMALKTKIQTEFKGFKPPVASGARALYDVVTSLYHRKNLSVSGFVEELGVVSGGILDVATLKFTQPKINDVTHCLLQKAVNTHKETFFSLIMAIK